MTETNELATFALGCFWCSEAIFEKLKGVEKVISGYTGSETQNLSYEDVSEGSSRHAEAIQITYNPKKISYVDLLYVFWRLHDPTTLNRQGADIGTQYRSAIFYHNEKQKNLALQSKKEVEKEKLYKNPIVTEIAPFDNFYEAEKYHQNFYTTSPEKIYCRFVIDPKIEKLKKGFKNYLK